MKKPNIKEKKDKLKGIKGWLILPVIHMFYYIVVYLYDLSEYPWGLDGNILWELVLIDVIGIALVIVTLTLAFKEKRPAKNFFIVSYIFVIVVNIFTFMITSDESLLSGSFGAIIWIWYFSVSKRVKNTFVK